MAGYQVLMELLWGCACVILKFLAKAHTAGRRVFIKVVVLVEKFDLTSRVVVEAG